MTPESAARVTARDIGLFLIRGIVGVVFLFHGSQKLFGWFEGPGLQNWEQALAQMQVPYPHVSAILSGCAEFFGGLFFLLGLFTRIAAIPIAITMAVAVFKVHNTTFSITAEPMGMEYALTLGLVAIGIAFTGPGRLSLDHVLWSRGGVPDEGKVR